MGPKQTPNKKGNTLFSYFSKKSVDDDNKNLKSPCHDILSPKRSPNNKSSNATPKSASKLSGTPEQAAGDVVWAKLEGYPWWPSLVCNHPTDNIHVKLGKNPQVHVQFFDNPPTRAWVKARNVKPFKGSDDQDFQKGGPFYSLNMQVRKGTTSADEAMKLSIPDRLKLVVDLQPSDEEDESMDYDPDIFDDEMDEEMDNSKENEDIKSEDKETAKTKTPSKSPKKGASTRKSARKPKPKRRRIIDNNSDDNDDSEDEFKPHSDDESDEEESSGVDENDVSEPDTESESGSPVKMPVSKKRKRPAPSKRNTTPWKPAKKNNASPEKEESEDEDIKPKKKNLGSFTPVVAEKTKSKLASFTAVDSGPSTSKGTEQEANFPHLKFEFLQPDKIKDAKGKSRNDPDYDPRTLHIPDSFKKQLTPALRQWWELKSKLFDTVLFFKMGKFYELFHMDAVIAVNELGLIYMKGEHAHSGFPEIAYNRYADSLIQKGYKVARIEQTETPDMMGERIKNMSKTVTKFDKVVKREICRITTRGTQTFNFLDGDCSEAKSSYLLSICEKEEGTDGSSSYGVCFVDTSIGKFHIGQFTDDRHSSRLRTLIAHFTPAQVLIEKGKMSEKSQLVINSNLTSVMKEYLRPGTEFWDCSKTLKVLAEEDYFKDEEFKWPQCLKKMISDADTLGLSAADEYSLAVRALGALTWYLQFCLLDQELLSMKNFEDYTPPDVTATPTQKLSSFSGKQHMVLDGVTLANLDITENSTTGSVEGTLLERLDQCCTPFGKRLFKQWLCAPLCNPASINDRLDATDDLNSVPEVVAEVVELIRKLPDLEKILSRIHSLGSAAKSKSHPDSRAIMFDEAKYSKKKIEDFLTTLDGFKTAAKVAKKFKDHVSSFKSKLLKKTMTLDSAESQEGHFPDLKEELQFFDNAFDHSKARKDGVIVPTKGVDPDYDEAKLDIQTTEKALDAYLDQQKTRLGCRSIVFWGSGKSRFQMEIPENVAKRVPDEYELMSSKKGAKRYRTKQIEKHLAELVDAEERKDVALKDTMRRIFHSFDERYKKWDTALQCLSVLDVLMSLAKYSKSADGIVCRPEVISPDENTEPHIEIREARHPCISRTFTGGDFIPNDTVIGIKNENEMEDDDSDTSNSNSKIVLVTGPNMGGKSTLMRQVGLITIMAQMGCYVPAERCCLTPVDRVFTRLGASDRIMAGESTFFVELSETSAILQHATKHSLVLMDELGRGTATYDGTAIACSVVQELSQKVCCRTLFSTHYHTLVEEFSHDPNIRLGHMACMVENEDQDDPSQETITFLYKFAKGACPKSYGFNAARLANIPEDVIRVAVHKSKEFEETVDRVRVLKSLWGADGAEKIRNLQPQICVS